MFYLAAQLFVMLQGLTAAHTCVERNQLDLLKEMMAQGLNVHSKDVQASLGMFKLPFN